MGDARAHVRRRVLHLADERHDGAAIAQRGERIDDLDADGGRRIVQSAEQRSHRLRGSLSPEGGRRGGAHVGVRVAEGACEGRDGVERGELAGDLAGLAAKARVARIEP